MRNIVRVVIYYTQLKINPNTQGSFGLVKINVKLYGNLHPVTIQNIDILSTPPSSCRISNTCNTYSKIFQKITARIPVQHVS